MENSKIYLYFLILVSFQSFSQATFSPEMTERNKRERAERAKVYEESRAQISKQKELETRKKVISDSLIEIKNKELTKKRAEEDAKIESEILKKKQESLNNSNGWEVETEVVKPNFVIDKIALSKLEKDLKTSDYYSVQDKERYSGLLILENKSTKIADGKYIKLSSILENDKFVYVSQSPSLNYYLIKNVKTQVLYAIHTFSFNYIDYSKSAVSGHKNLINQLPLALTNKEQELITRYKGLIKSAEINTKALRSIQERCITKGYFDQRKMTKTDKISFNKNLQSLKDKASNLSDIDRYEDLDNKAQDKLTTPELVSLQDIHNWVSNFSTIE